MTQRTSLIEQYNNRDVIAQIYRLISLVESSTIIRTTSVQEGSTVTVTFEMFDGTTKQFTFTNNADMTTDTEQNVTALKNFLAGLNVTGNMQIDGDTLIVNGHSLQVAGDLDIAGDTELAGRLTAHGQSEIAGMAIEESSGATVLSNANGIKSASPVTLSGDVVVPTTVTGQRDTEAVNGERLQNDLDAYGPMFRLIGDQTVNSGKKTFKSPLLDDKAYLKNSNSSTYVPLFKLTDATISDGYFEVSMLVSGRNSSFRAIRLTWSKANATLTKTVDIGNDNLSYYVAIDTNGAYWVCAGINNNQSIFASNIRLLRNAGFAETAHDYNWVGTSPDVSAWTVQAVTP